MRRLAALVVLPLALGAPARRHAAQQDDTDVLKPSYATCHEPKMKEVCPAYNTIMYMCCSQYMTIRTRPQRIPATYPSFGWVKFFGYMCVCAPETSVGY